MLEWTAVDIPNSKIGSGKDLCGNIVISYCIGYFELREYKILNLSERWFEFTLVGSGQVDAISVTTAFTPGTNVFPLTVNQSIIWGKVLVNLQGGYDVNTGTIQIVLKMTFSSLCLMSNFSYFYIHFVRKVTMSDINYLLKSLPQEMLDWVSSCLFLYSLEPCYK